MSRGVFLSAKKPLDNDFIQLCECYLRDPMSDVYLTPLLEYDLENIDPQTKNFLCQMSTVQQINHSLNLRDFDPQSSVLAYNVANSTSSEEITKFFLQNSPLQEISFLFWSICPSLDQFYLLNNKIISSSYFLAIQHAIIMKFDYQLNFCSGINLNELDDFTATELLKTLQLVDNYQYSFQISIKLLQITTSTTVTKQALKLLRKCKISFQIFMENLHILTCNLNSINGNILVQQLNLLIEQFEQVNEQQSQEIISAINLDQKLLIICENKQILQAKEICDLICDIMFLCRNSEELILVQNEIIDLLKYRFKGRESLTLKQLIQELEYNVDI